MAAEVLVAEVEVISVETVVVVAAADPTTETIIILVKISKTTSKIKIKINNKVQSLTNEVPKLLQMFPTTPAPGTGRKVAKLPTVATPSSVAGPTLLCLENELLASLTRSLK